MTRKARGRGPVVHLDRTKKAQSIEAFLRDHLGVAQNSPICGRRILDIGGGNGMISQHFAGHNEVHSVDVVEQRREPDPRVKFQLVDSEELPFEDAFFDIVLSHHVIEHVVNQDLHLSEMRRVIRADGVCWLGTPNKTSPIMEGHIGNDQVLHYREMKPLFERHEFVVHECSVQLMRRPFVYHCEKRFGRFVPTFALELLKPFFPSHAFILRPSFHPRSCNNRRRMLATRSRAEDT